MSNIKIEVPEGKKAVQTEIDGGICIKFEDDKPSLPQRWDDLGGISGFYTDAHCRVRESKHYPKPCDNCKDVWPTKELAEASIAMDKLAQLRDRYNDGWVPDWVDDSRKFVICFLGSGVSSDTSFHISSFLAFKTKELRDKFFSATEIRKDIETARPLLGG